MDEMARKAALNLGETAKELRGFMESREFIAVAHRSDILNAKVHILRDVGFEVMIDRDANGLLAAVTVNDIRLAVDEITEVIT